MRYGPMRLRSAPFSFPLLIGELACGNLANRAEIQALLEELPQARVAEHDEVLRFIEARRLSGRGLGFIDAHLLASAALTQAVSVDGRQTAARSSFRSGRGLRLSRGVWRALR
ncbi:MAG: hypothetical protein WCQ45_02620 [bacterium]